MKEYVKPALFCESFQLTEMIAGNCDLIMNLADKNICKEGHLKDPGSLPGSDPKFTQGDTACVVKSEDYCYWPGSTFANGFVS